jgi:hypothetical protein
MRSVVTRSIKNNGDLRLDDWRTTASRPAPERICKARRGHNDISVCQSFAIGAASIAMRLVVWRMSIEVAPAHPILAV